MKSGLRHPLFLVMLAFLLLSGGSALQAENLAITLEAGQYRIIDAGDGEQVIRMDGFGNLLIPGKPMLPAKSFMIALPPGAEILSVGAEGITTVEVQGQYSIEPAPPVLPSDGREEMIRECRQRWQDNYDLTYSSDQAYPENAGRYLGTGELRKYTFIRVGYFPFSYHPQSGRLTFTPSLDVSIDYRLPSSTDERFEELLSDTKGELRASRLLVNYTQAKEWYLLRTPRQAPK